MTRSAAGHDNSHLNYYNYTVNHVLAENEQVPVANNRLLYHHQQCFNHHHHNHQNCGVDSIDTLPTSIASEISNKNCSGTTNSNGNEYEMVNTIEL